SIAPCLLATQDRSARRLLPAVLALRRLGRLRLDRVALPGMHESRFEKRVGAICVPRTLQGVGSDGSRQRRLPIWVASLFRLTFDCTIGGFVDYAFPPGGGGSFEIRGAKSGTDSNF